MIVNEKDKFVIDYYPMNSNIADEIQNPDKISENILNNFNEHPKELNNLYDLNRWDEYKDNILSQLVLFYNFDFKKIADVFDKLCNIKRETDLDGGEIPVYTEKILRYHWSFIHARRFFGKKTGEEFYILNRDEKSMKLNEDKFEQKEIEKENFPKDITTDKNLVNTINVNSLNKEKDLNSYFDKLLNQEMDKERTKLFEMELKEKATKNDSFPIKLSKNDGEKNVNDIINNIKQKEKNKKEEIERQKIEKQKEEEKEMEY
jgi:hypothetical protein